MVYRCYKNLFERSCSLSCEFIDLYFSPLFERVCFFDGSIDLYFSKQFEGSSYFFLWVHWAVNFSPLSFSLLQFLK